MAISVLLLMEVILGSVAGSSVSFILACLLIGSKCITCIKRERLFPAWRLHYCSAQRKKSVLINTVSVVEHVSLFSINSNSAVFELSCETTCAGVWQFCQGEWVHCQASNESQLHEAQMFNARRSNARLFTLSCTSDFSCHFILLSGICFNCEAHYMACSR